jgi:hypothetical protein
MPNIVTGIAPHYDADGNYHLEVTADGGSTLEVLIPPQMEFQVRTVIQENEARRQARMSGMFGYMVLDVTNVEAADTHEKSDRTLIVETKQLGLWGLRVSEATARKAALALQTLLGRQRTDRQVH